MNNKNIAPDKWPSTKKLDIANQMLIYKEIFEQYGLTVGSINIIPIKLNLIYENDGVSIKSVDNVVLEPKTDSESPFSSDVRVDPRNTLFGSTAATNIRSIFNYETEVKTEGKLLSVNDKMRRIFPKYTPFISNIKNPNVEWFIKDEGNT